MVRLYHGTGNATAKKILKDGLVPHRPIGKTMVPSINTIGLDTADFSDSWLTTDIAQAFYYAGGLASGPAVIEFDIPDKFVTRSRLVSKPVYIEGTIAVVRGGIPPKYIRGIHRPSGKFEAVAQK